MHCTTSCLTMWSCHWPYRSYASEMTFERRDSERTESSVTDILLRAGGGATAPAPEVCLGLVARRPMVEMSETSSPQRRVPQPCPTGPTHQSVVAVAFMSRKKDHRRHHRVRAVCGPMTKPRLLRGRSPGTTVLDITESRSLRPGNVRLVDPVASALSLS